MDVVCPRCASAVVAADVDLPGRLAKCRQCNAVFDLRRSLAASGGAPLTRREPLLMPEGITVLEEGEAPAEPGYRSAPRPRGNLVISRRWYGAKHLATIGFCVFWNGFLVVWYWLVLSMPEPPLTHVLFPLIHVAVGLGVTYGALCGLVNKTRIIATPDSLSIHHGPLPARGNRTLAAVDLQQLFTEEHAGTGKNAAVSWSLSAVTRDGARLVLLRDLPTPFHALFLEERLEEHLGIAPEVVPGELGGV